MSLSTNKFYQLRNITAEVKNENGDFITKLKEPLKIEEGDQIIMAKSILDTRSVDSGKIVLENDTEFKISFNYYIRFNKLEGKIKFGVPGTPIPLTDADIDCDPYIFCRRIANTTTAYRADSFSISASGTTSSKNDTFILDIQYTSVDGTDKVAHVKMTRAGFGWFSGTGLDIVAIDNGSGTNPTQLFRISQQTKDFISSINGDPDSYDPSVVEDDSSFTCVPQTYTQSTIIKSGSYDPDDLAERITRGMTLLETSEDYIDFYSAGSNNLLTNTSTSSYLALTNRVWINMYKDPSPNPPQNHFAFESLGAGTTHQPYLIGTSQFALEFDEVTQRFKFSYLHFPLYESGASDIITKFVGVFGSSNKSRLCSAEGGILLESLTSIDQVTGENTNLWGTAFGFELNELCPVPRMINSTHITALIPRYIEQGAIGKYFTQGDSNIDVGVVKRFNIEAQQTQGLSSIISASQTEPIFAKQSFGQVNLTSGYFLIEINGLYNDGLITNTDLKNHIFGIVGRFYENENYTTGTDADALVYQHKGSVQYINQFSVRILNDDFELADGLGVDNTIFLQHVKSIQPPQPEKK